MNITLKKKVNRSKKSVWKMLFNRKNKNRCQVSKKFRANRLRMKVEWNRSHMWLERSLLLEMQLMITPTFSAKVIHLKKVIKIHRELYRVKSQKLRNQNKWKSLKKSKPLTRNTNQSNKTWFLNLEKVRQINRDLVPNLKSTRYLT